jgi:alkylated DNA repair dioxygenase AlkB
MQIVRSQTELFLTPGATTFQHLPGDCRYLQDYLTTERASGLLAQLRSELPWQQQAIYLFGKQVMQPRLICWQADAGMEYGYSGIRLVAAEWHPEVTRLRQHLHSELGLEFNSALINAYRDGQDSMGWHSDDEPELGPGPVIASISLGAERQFRWRHKRSATTQGMKLGHGSLLLLGGQFQQEYQHSVPKTRTVTELRINLTFRRVFNTSSKHGAF